MAALKKWLANFLTIYITSIIQNIFILLIFGMLKVKTRSTKFESSRQLPTKRNDLNLRSALERTLNSANRNSSLHQVVLYLLQRLALGLRHAHESVGNNEYDQSCMEEVDVALADKEYHWLVGLRGDKGEYRTHETGYAGGNALDTRREELTEHRTGHAHETREEGHVEQKYRSQRQPLEVLVHAVLQQVEVNAEPCHGYGHAQA